MLRISIFSLDDYEKLSTSRSDTCIIFSGPGTNSRNQRFTPRKFFCALSPRTNQHLG